MMVLRGAYNLCLQGMAKRGYDVQVVRSESGTVSAENKVCSFEIFTDLFCVGFFESNGKLIVA